MARSFVFPDIKDRSPNHPIVLVSPEQVLGMYNQCNKSKQKLMIDEDVKVWYRKEAHDRGWSKATFTGHQCLLELEFIVA